MPPPGGVPASAAPARAWGRKKHGPRNPDGLGRTLLAANLKRCRGARGLTQDELARAAGTSQQWVSIIESRRRSATVDMVEKFARALDVPVGELFAALPAAPTDTPPSPCCGRNTKRGACTWPDCAV